MKGPLPAMRERYGSQQTLRPDTSRRRALVVAVFLCVWMVVVGARLAYLQTAQHEWLSQRARKQQVVGEDLSPVRGLILDRQGRELARSVDVDSLFADPREIENVDDAAARLSGVLGIDGANLSARMRQG